MAKARAADCDAVILDLEDAVAPEEKVAAREAAIAAVREGGFGERLVIIRVNGANTEWGADDIGSMAQAAPGAVLLPKVDDAAALEAARAGLPDSIALWAMIETCTAFGNLRSLGEASARSGTTCWVMGTNDLALEMRCSLEGERQAVLPLLTSAICMARAHGLAILDGVFNDLSDEDGLAAECAQGRRLGFDGKTVIHPKQLAAANAAFGPSDAEIARARAVNQAFAAPENAGKGVLKVDGRMVELLHLREAERTLAMAEAIARRAG